MTAQRSGLFTLGEALAVFIPHGATTLASATSYRRTVAGSEMNVAVAVSRLGHPARLLTVVGRDGLGDAVSGDLEREGVDLAIVRSNLPTGTLVRELAATSESRAVNLRRSSAITELGPQHVDAAWLADPAVVFVTGITAVRSESSLRAVQRTVARARAAGSLVVVDPNLRPALASREEFAVALSTLRGLVDVAIGDDAELALLSGTSEEEAEAALIAQGCRLVITKLGADGARATDGHSAYRVRSHASKVVDTVGAGDAFAAGVIVGMIEGGAVAEVLEFASRVAARVVATEGDIEGLPYRAEIEAVSGVKS